MAGIDGLFYGAAGLVGVGAGSETAIAGEFQHFGKVEGDLLFLKMYQAEASKAGRVNDEATGCQRVHLVQGCCVTALKVGEGYVADLRV